jgi:hypothetical protein
VTRCGPPWWFLAVVVLAAVVLFPVILVTELVAGVYRWLFEPPAPPSYSLGE